MAAELQRDFGVKADMEKSKGGIFDVHVDGKLVFSKHKVDRFPEDGEVSKLIRNLQVSPKKS